MVLDSPARRVTYVTADVVADDDLVHPYLAAAVPWFALLEGRQALHAGAFIANGRAWALVGPPGRGKSSILGRLHQDGYTVITDDLVVVDDRSVLAGPRCLDLRPSSAEVLRITEATPARDGSRSRVVLGPCPSATPIAGWITLEWASRLELRSLSASERVRILNPQRMAYDHGADASGVLELLGLPGWALRRPRDWDLLDKTLESLLALTRESAGD